MRLFGIFRRRREPKRWTNQDQPNRVAAEVSNLQQYLPGGNNVRKPSLKQAFVLSAALLAVAALATRVRADSHLLFYNAATGTAATGYVDRDGNYSDLQVYPNGFSPWTHIVAQ